VSPRHVSLLAICVLLLPRTADAHSTFKGAGDFYGGMLHPVLTPTHGLLLASLGLCLGPLTSSRLEYASFAFVPALSVGMIVAAAASIGDLPPWILLAIAALAGSLAAVGRDVPPAVAVALAVVAALVLGLDSAPGGSSPWGTILSAIGTWLGVLIIYAYAIGLVAFAVSRPWLKLAVRVLGSWTAASAMLVLALAIR
jgi:urease accessory protein